MSITPFTEEDIRICEAELTYYRTLLTPAVTEWMNDIDRQIDSLVQRRREILRNKTNAPIEIERLNMRLKFIKEEVAKNRASMRAMDKHEEIKRGGSTTSTTSTNKPKKSSQEKTLAGLPEDVKVLLRKAGIKC